MNSKCKARNILNKNKWSVFAQVYGAAVTNTNTNTLDSLHASARFEDTDRYTSLLPQGNCQSQPQKPPQSQTRLCESHGTLTHSNTPSHSGIGQPAPLTKVQSLTSKVVWELCFLLTEVW